MREVREHRQIQDHTGGFLSMPSATPTPPEALDAAVIWR